MKKIFSAADILIPAAGTNMSKWSVPACDQYTSQPEHWEETKNISAGHVSALNLILPEVYLGKDDETRISEIQRSMTEYLDSGVFRTDLNDTMIYVERMTSDGLRCGIVGKIDLEEYDYHKGSRSAVRATEETIAERIPPRIKIRRGAPLELPHIMILIDDPDDTVIAPLAAKKADMEKLYDFELMQGGGRIAGYRIGSDIQAEIGSALDRLSEKSDFVYAMGDGNHSLATAKEYYEELKRENPGKDMSSHPARYALVELVSLQSPAIRFEAIHRLITDTDTDSLLSAMKEKLSLTENEEDQNFEMFIGDKHFKFGIGTPLSKLTVGSVQKFLDGYLKESGGNIDYIHGKDTVKSLAAEKNGIGIVLPDMKKEELFPAVSADGALPRKTFSMGTADDKRYYTEARRITE